MASVPLESGLSLTRIYGQQHIASIELLRMSLPVNPVVSQQETQRLLILRSPNMGLPQESIYLKTMSDPLCSDGAVAKLKNTIFRAQYLIKIYASSQEMRPEVLSAELSNDIDIQDLQWLIRQFEMADFSTLPAVEVRSRLAIAGAWSRYVPEVNTIYLAGDFVENASKETLKTVLLREIIDAMKKFM